MTERSDQQKARLSILLPLGFITILWAVRAAEWLFTTDINYLGIFPRQFFGLIGVFTGPFIHSDFGHLASNTVPLFLLGAGILYFYRPIAFKILVLIFFLTNFFVWVGARPSFHIGASGIIYGMATFLLFSGYLRKEKRLLALSFLVIFIYGSMTWGIFPGQRGVSWESHLFGAIVGTVLAFYYRKEGPQRKKYDWELEEEQEKEEKSYEESIKELGFKKQRRGGKVRYIYRDE